MGLNIFLDTDVVLDHLTGREPFARYATEIFALHEQGEVVIHLSALCINNVYYVACKLIGAKKALAMIDRLIEYTQVIGTTKQELKLALQVGFGDFEGGIQYATALTPGNIDTIITRNTKDYRKSRIAVMDPEVFLETRT